MSTIVDPQRALVVYAFVSEGLKANNDVLEGLIPLFLPIAQDLSGHPFDPNQLVTELSRRYGLETTTDVTEFFIPRLKNSKLVAEAPGSRIIHWLAPEKKKRYNHHRDHNRRDFL